jgi:S1-C subfamily serine protease
MNPIGSRRRQLTRAAVSWVSLPLLVLACGDSTGPSARNASDVGKTVERERELASPGTCIGKQRLLEALGSKEQGPPAARAREKYRTDPFAASVSPSEAYRLGAPTTVIIRTREGLGSGVVVDPSGLVLTNYHVVDDFLQPDLTMNVSLEIAEVEPTGRVKRSGKVFQGTVLKSDPVKDLALVRMKDPPKDLAFVKLSEADPQIGEDTLSIGHAGIGLLWAAKVCNVSGIGDQTRDTSMLEVGDCKLRDPSDSESEARRRQEQCEARKRQVREMLGSATQGLAVQTNCNVTHGDSGGPLLNLRGELVGLNQSLRFDATTVTFHVHVAEIRAFLKDVPAAPGQVLPDPWCEGGSEASWEDVDGDGKKETLKLVGSSIGHSFGMDSAEATFIDLDQDDDAKKRSKARPFDAEVIVLNKGDGYFTFYDTDNDGTMDLVLRDKEGEGKADFGWRWKGGKYEQDLSLKGSKVVDVAWVKAEDSRSRLGAVAQGLGWNKISSDATKAVAERVRVPDIYSGNIQEARAMAQEMNEKPFGVHGFGPSGDIMVVDTRSEALRALKDGDDARKLFESRALAPEFVMMGRPNGRWTFYDTDGDGKLDLALFGKNPQDKESFMSRMSSYATDAFDLRGAEPKHVNRDIGRSLMRVALLGSEKARKLGGRFLREGNDGRATFPDPYNVYSRSPWKFGAVDGTPRRTMERLDASAASILFDLDGDTKDVKTKAPEDYTRQRSYDWEIAMVREGRLAWILYDTDNDGAYDLVHFTRDVAKKTVDAAYTLDRGGEKVTQLSDVPVELLVPERVTKNARQQAALREAWQRVLESKKEEDDDAEDGPKRDTRDVKAPKPAQPKDPQGPPKPVPPPPPPVAPVAPVAPAAPKKR